MEDILETRGLIHIGGEASREKLISVIIPCRNVSKWLPQCFLSLVHQTIGINNIELIFVDDASDDGGATWTLLTEMEKAYPESIAVIGLNENMRQGGARNIALKYATGKYLAFVDADDFVAENFLLEVYKKAEETNADIVQFEHFLFTENGSVIKAAKLNKEFINITTDEDRKKFLFEEKLTCGCWNKLYKRELIENAGVCFAEKVIYEEPLFVYPLFFHCNRVLILDEPYYYYRQNNLGTMRNDMKAKNTLFEHSFVQRQVLEAMKKTEYFERFYEEIKLYFLHSYLYETLLFAAKRKIYIDYKEFTPLAQFALGEYEDIDNSPYSTYIPKQMELYKLIKHEFTMESYNRYFNSLR